MKVRVILVVWCGVTVTGAARDQVWWPTPLAPTSSMCGERSRMLYRPAGSCTENLPEPLLRECSDAGSCQLVALTRVPGLDPVGGVGRLPGIGVLGRLAGLGVLGRQRRLDLVRPFPLVDPGLAVDTARPKQLTRGPGYR